MGPNIWLAKLLPLSIYRQYLSMLGFFYYGMNSGERKHVSQSLKYVLGEKINRIAFQSILWKTYFGIFEHYLEKMINAHKDLSEMMDFLNNKIKFSGRFMLDQAITGDKGCILVTGHFGAVEYIPLFLASNHYRPSMILRFKTNKLREALVHKSRSVDLELIDADNPNVIFQALNAIKQGRILITLCDEIHSWRPCSKNNARLFGTDIPKDRTLDILYKRSKAPVCFGILRRENSAYDFCIRPLADGRSARSICESSWGLLERHVYANPEQWYQWPSFYPEFTRYISNKACYEY
jgi:lauroyl/myristoyl acyltransferase